MTDERPYPSAIDPDNVQEVFCNGQFVVETHGEFATLTFGHVRTNAAALFKCDETNYLKIAAKDAALIVRARLVMPIPNLIALRDLLNRITKNPEGQAHAIGGTRH